MSIFEARTALKHVAGLVLLAIKILFTIRKDKEESGMISKLNKATSV